MTNYNRNNLKAEHKLKLSLKRAQIQTVPSCENPTIFNKYSDLTELQFACKVEIIFMIKGL